MYSKKLNDSELFEQTLAGVRQQTDKSFAILLILEWLGSVVMALSISPWTWAGSQHSIHPHVVLSLFLGSMTALVPAMAAWSKPGHISNRYAIMVAQVVFSGLFIHITGGRIETHFFIFGSLAFLAFYNDFPLVLIAALLTGADHLIRGVYWPESVYGVLYASPWRTAEHATWITFEVTVLYFSIRRSRATLLSLSKRQAETDAVLSLVGMQAEEQNVQLETLTQELDVQTAKLMQSSRLSALGEMAASIAHEINNPLSIILGRTTQLKRIAQDLEAGARAKKYLDEIEATTHRMAKIVTGLKTFAKGGNDTPFEKVDLKTIVEDVAVLCQDKFRNRAVRLSTDLPSVSVECRPIQIGQILLNLLNNAFDAVSADNSAWVKVVCRPMNSNVSIEVIDSGHGISADVAKKLMEPFFTTKSNGTGLGLSISRGIANAHGGSLKLDTFEGHTRFTLTLPYVQPREEGVAHAIAG